MGEKIISQSFLCSLSSRAATCCSSQESIYCSCVDKCMLAQNDVTWCFFMEIIHVSCATLYHSYDNLILIIISLFSQPLLPRWRERCERGLISIWCNQKVEIYFQLSREHLSFEFLHCLLINHSFKLKLNFYVNVYCNSIYLQLD